METNSKVIFSQFSLITKDTPLGPVPYIPELYHSDKIRYQVQVPFSVVENTMDNSAPCLKYLLIFSPRSDIQPRDGSFVIVYNHRDKKEEYVIDMRDQMDYFESMIFNRRLEFTRYTQDDLSFDKLRLMMKRYVDIIQMPCVFDKYINNIVNSLPEIYAPSDEFIKKKSFYVTTPNLNETTEKSEYVMRCKKNQLSQFELEITDTQCVLEFETRTRSSFFTVGLGKERDNYISDSRYRTSIIDYLDAYRRFGENGKLVFTITALTFEDQDVVIKKFVGEQLEQCPVIKQDKDIVLLLARTPMRLLLPDGESSIGLCDEHRGSSCALVVRGKKLCLKLLRLTMWKPEIIKGVTLVMLPSEKKEISTLIFNAEQLKYLTLKSQYRDIMK